MKKKKETSSEEESEQESSEDNKKHKKSAKKDKKQKKDKKDTVWTYFLVSKLVKNCLDVFFIGNFPIDSRKKVQENINNKYWLRIIIQIFLHNHSLIYFIITFFKAMLEVLYQNFSPITYKSHKKLKIISKVGGFFSYIT